MVWQNALWKLPSLPLIWIPQNGIHNRLEFLRNSTGSWKSLRDSHSSHRAYNWALSSLTVSFQAQPQDVVGTHSKPGSAQKKPPSLPRLNDGSRFIAHDNINLVNGIVKSSKA